MSKTFTYIIRSDSRLNQNDNTNSCTIRLNCPSNYQYFDCEVETLLLSTKSYKMVDSFCELRADGLQFVDGNDTKHNKLKSLGFYSFENKDFNGHLKFRLANFNNSEILFTLYNDDNTLLKPDIGTTAEVLADYDEPWILVLKMTGVNEA